MGAETKRPSSPQLGMCMSGDKFFTTLHMPINDCESAENTNFEITNTFQQVIRFTQTLQIISIDCSYQSDIHYNAF